MGWGRKSEHIEWRRHRRHSLVGGDLCVGETIKRQRALVLCSNRCCRNHEKER
ncbi:hypothetical protein LINPERPRIM_LOCUS26122 [Linum perenne]